MVAEGVDIPEDSVGICFPRSNHNQPLTRRAPNASESRTTPSMSSERLLPQILAGI